MTRLHITVTPPREKRRSLRVPMSEPVPKRPRLHQQQQGEQSFTTTSSAGFIQICDVDPSGKFVRIKNMSAQVRNEAVTVVCLTNVQGCGVAQSVNMCCAAL